MSTGPPAQGPRHPVSTTFTWVRPRLARASLRAALRDMAPAATQPAPAHRLMQVTLGMTGGYLAEESRGWRGYSYFWRMTGMLFGLMLWWTVLSTKQVGARPQAPRQRTTSRLNSRLDMV